VTLSVDLKGYFICNNKSANVENMVSSNNARKWQMGFNSAFKGLKSTSV